MTVKARHNGRSHYNITNDVEKLKAALFDTTHDIRGRAGEMLIDSVSSVKDHTIAVKDNLADYTARKPFKALGIALTAGVVLGLLIKR